MQKFTGFIHNNLNTENTPISLLIIPNLSSVPIEMIELTKKYHQNVTFYSLVAKILQLILGGNMMRMVN
jgi:hypothetical protein